MICIPVVAATQAEALHFIHRSADLADILELRMDLLADGNLKGLLAAVRSAAPAVQVLVTNRPRNAASASGEKERIAVLMEAVSLGADFVDVELATATRWTEKVRTLIGENKDRTRLVVSHHDFRQTPSRQELVRLLNAAVQAGAQVTKIVTQACTQEDNLVILSLIPYARRRKLEIIAFCMGNQGKMSRVMAPLMGSLFTFAALEEGSESAPGQLTVRALRQIWREMGEKHHADE
jgi:3-dehydroquinate dehydratase type I